MVCWVNRDRRQTQAEKNERYIQKEISERSGRLWVIYGYTTNMGNIWLIWQQTPQIAVCHIAKNKNGKNMFSPHPLDHGTLQDMDVWWHPLKLSYDQGLI